MRSHSIVHCIPRHSALSVSLAIGLGLSLPLPTRVAAQQNAASSTLSTHAATQTWRADAQGHRPAAQTHTVNTCADDDSPGSLRAIIASPNTGSDDIIDLTQLPMGCSTITLDSGTHVPSYIKVAQSYLHLLGPGAGQLTIDGAYDSSVLRHVGYGTLEIKGVTIANGKYISDTQPFGGCVYSEGTVDLESSRLENCRAAGTGMTSAAGGGVYTKAGLTMYRSSISSSGAFDTQDTAGKGGGAFVRGNLQATYATIRDNYASYYGGGAYVTGSTVSISSSTISSNRAQSMGGLYFSNDAGTAEVINSTISGNGATAFNGGLFARGALKLANSTVAFNRDRTDNYAGVGAQGASLQIDSAIISGNVGLLGPADLWAHTTTMVSGSNNLIVAGTSVPAGTIRDCPQLEPLADNGGATLTHAIRHTSPALDAGSTCKIFRSTRAETFALKASRPTSGLSNGATAQATSVCSWAALTGCAINDAVAIT